MARQSRHGGRAGRPEAPVAKGYWVIAWKSVSDPAEVGRYVAPATEAIVSYGGRVVIAAVPARTYEEGLSSRTVLVEFESLDAAIAAYESPDYQATLVHLHGTAERDERIVRRGALSSEMAAHGHARESGALSAVNGAKVA